MIKYDRLNANMLTPLSVFKGLNAKFLLESASMNVSNRYSLIIKDINFAILKENNGYFYKDSNGIFDLKNLHSYENRPAILDLALKYINAQSSENANNNAKDAQSKHIDSKDFLYYIDLFRKLAPSLPKELENLQMLSLGGIGYLGFEFFSECENIEFDKSGLYDAPECYFCFPKESVIFDHFYDEMFLVCNSYEGLKNECDSLLLNLKKDIDNLEFKKTPINENIQSQIVYEDNQEWFENAVEDIKDRIYKGVFLQCVLSRAICVKSNMEPMQFYEVLRRKNPSPYMYFLNFDDFKIIGASPELMLKVSDNKAFLKPIAGTRARGKDLAQDLALENELLNDKKENAEHLMLLDLARNDLGRNAKSGSVKVNMFRVIEKYSSVMHMVSEVQCELDDNISAIDSMKCVFPAGTVSGAPKIMAIKVISELENHRRGVYGGTIAYFRANGELNSAIAIRTAVFKDDIYYLQVGAGIVLDSKKDKEFEETNNKLHPLLDTLNIKV